MNNDCLEVDELILEIADYTNDYVDMAAEKLWRKCSTSWEAYNTRETAHDGWLPNSACQQLRRIIKKKYRCDCSRAANTGGHLNNREREA